jgi:hypothetical protein
MSQVVRFEGDDGSFMLVEVTPVAQSEIGLVADETGVARAAARLEDSLASIRGAAVALMSTVDRIEARPEEVRLELALSLAVEGGVIVARGSAKAEASVVLIWRWAAEA